jgi:hypothetical protein
MIGSILAIFIIGMIIVYYIMKATKEQKDKTPVLELLSNPSVIKSLDLKPGSALTLNASDVHKEVHVLSSPQGVRIGTLNQPFVYKGVLKNELFAKIHAIEGATLKVEVIHK